MLDIHCTLSRTIYINVTSSYSLLTKSPLFFLISTIKCTILSIRNYIHIPYLYTYSNKISSVRRRQIVRFVFRFYLPQHKFVVIIVEQHYLSLNTVTCRCPFIESNLDKSVSIWLFRQKKQTKKKEVKKTHFLIENIISTLCR